MKPRTISGMISRIAKADSKFSSLEVHRRDSFSTLSVIVGSATAKIDLQEEFDFPLARTVRGDGWYLLEWDISTMWEKPERVVEPYCFSDGAKAVRKTVTKQEDEAAAMIGGRRHAGSGSITGIKSDASSTGWQLEAKMAVKRRSIAVSVDWLTKLTHEAAVVGKKPILYLTFGNIPDGVRMEDTWVVIPRSVFEKINVG